MPFFPSTLFASPTLHPYHYMVMIRGPYFTSAVYLVHYQQNTRGRLRDQLLVNFVVWCNEERRGEGPSQTPSGELPTFAALIQSNDYYLKEKRRWV